MTTAEKIKYFRKKLGLTQSDLAKMSNLHPVSIRKYESNKMQPLLPQVEKIASALGVSPNALIGLENSNLRLETIGDFMSILYMLLETDLLTISGERCDDEQLIIDTIQLNIKNKIVLSQLAKWEKISEMRKRVCAGNNETSEDVYNALVDKMDELLEKVSLETQRSQILIKNKEGC